MTDKAQPTREAKVEALKELALARKHLAQAANILEDGIHGHDERETPSDPTWALVNAFHDAVRHFEDQFSEELETDPHEEIPAVAA